MRPGTLVLNTLVCLVGASPLEPRQILDYDLLEAAPDVPTYTVPLDATPFVVSYDLPAATQEAIEAPLLTETLEKRDLQSRTSDTCRPLNPGFGPIPSPDTAEAFLASTVFSDAAKSAPVPKGYEQTFSNLKASNSAYGYSGFSTLETYDTAECARRCNKVDTCVGFNIYFERDPSIVPGEGCKDPVSTTEIKCVYWGGYISASNANNAGQWRADFHVVIAGSNGYMKTHVDSVPGFNGVSLGNASINAPLNCLGQDTYMGVKFFTTSFFDPGLCGAACLSQNEYNLAHPPRPEEGKPKICRFFVTYLEQRNGNPLGQICAMYTQAWDKSYATNDGQWRGNDHYTNDYVFAYTNSECPGVPACPRTKN